MLAAGIGLTFEDVANAQDCDHMPVTRTAPGIPVIDWAENLGFDAAGDLWVTRNLTNRVERYDAAGHVTGVVEVVSPGAVRSGPDGLMYVTAGNSPTGLLPGSAAGAVVRFDPTDERPTPTVVVDGLSMPNGMAIAADGAIYIADSGRGLLRVRPDGSVDEQWSAAAPRNFDTDAQVNGFSLNGLALSGGDLYVTITASPSGRVLRVPLEDPAHAEVVTDLVPAARTAFPDDLVVTPSGALLVGTTLGALVRIDPETRATCTIYSGEPVTALAVDPQVPHRVIASTLTGAILVLDEA